MKKTIAIIGSGPAALLLAAMLNEKLFDITIYERSSAPARKLLIAGDGGLNLTHSEELEQFISRYTPVSFLEKSIRAFTNTDLRNWFKKIGIDTYVGTSKRIFPVKGIKPIDTLNAILAELKNKNVQLKTNHTWTGWNNKNELLIDHNTKTLTIKADKVVLALGGASWNKNGLGGDWAKAFKEKEIEVIPFQPSNCAYGIKWKEEFLAEAEGKWLKNISLTCNGNTIKGELVITKFGIEGGASYALSPGIRKQLNEKKMAEIFIDLKPAYTLEKIKDKLSKKGNRSYTKLLEDQLSLSQTHISLLKTILTKEEFTSTEILAYKIKKLPLMINCQGPIEDAISTVGGIALNEVDDYYQLKKIKNQYVIGEMLNWDAPTGGYLLQACFSMGAYLANRLNTNPD